MVNKVEKVRGYQAARRWYSKNPVTEIAKTLGVTRQTVQNWVSDLVAEREEERINLV